MARIHEILPVEADRAKAATLIVKEAETTFVKRADHFLGVLTKTEMYDEKRSTENTVNVKELVETVPNKLDHVWSSLIPALDVAMAKENSNVQNAARADVEVDGKVVLVGIPATGLLALERKLGQIRVLYETIPTLPPEFAWEPDTGAELEGVMRTKHPEEGHMTEKVRKVLTLAPATDKHPANVEAYNIDEKVAKVTRSRTSGMVSPASKSRMLKRITALEIGVKEARQRANMADVIELPVGDAIAEFIHG